MVVVPSGVCAGWTVEQGQKDGDGYSAGRATTHLPTVALGGGDLFGADHHIIWNIAS